MQDALESLLSKKNLVRDQFLAGSMNPQMYIPIHVLLTHSRLVEVEATEELVVAASRRSAKLGIDDRLTMVRPLLKSKRNVVILRDVADSHTEESIRALFEDGPFYHLIANIKPEVNNTWFVKFNLDDVQDVVIWLRSQRFEGKPVNAAIKSEHFLRSFFPMTMPGGMMPPSLGPMLSSEVWLDNAQNAGSMDYGTLPPFLQHLGMGKGGSEPAEFVSGKGMGMGVPEPWMTEPLVPPPRLGIQGPGFWRPWGARLQPAPLVFESKTCLAGMTPVPGLQPPGPPPEVTPIGEYHTPSNKGWGKGYKGKDGKEGRKGKGY